MTNLSFSDFLLTENKSYLGQKIGDVLSGVQSLNQDAGHLGTRQLVKMSTQIVNQIRRILHSAWPKQHEPHLKRLQKAGVAIMAGIEEKDDLPSILQAVATELEALSGDLGVPVNNMGSPEGAPAAPGEGPDEQGVAPPQGPEKAPQAPQGPPGGAPAQPMPGPPAPGGPAPGVMPPAAPAPGPMPGPPAMGAPAGIPPMPPMG